MDIHLPKVPHSWRELGKEIGIIVVGVVIALSAEQLVQDWQWHSRVKIAETAMRHELLWDDGPEIYQRAALHPCITAALDRIRSAVDSGADRGDVGRLVDGFSLPFFSYDSVARDAANASDAWSHMPTDETEPFTLLYAAMPVMNDTSIREAYDLARLRAFRRSGSGPLNDADTARLLESVEALRQDEQAMWLGIDYQMRELRKLGAIDGGSKRRLMETARAHYGACVRDLPPDFPSGPLPGY